MLINKKTIAGYMETYYTIYKVTNKINGKTYIGKHQTKNPYDSYLGSGILLKKAITKYGRDLFEKEILFIFDNEFEMNEKEKEILTESFIANENNYNLGIGGGGGPHFKNKKHDEQTKEKIRKSSVGKFISEEQKESISNALKGTKRSTKTINRISEAIKNRPIKLSKEINSKISKSIKEKYDNDPEYGRNKRKHGGKYVRTDEVRKKQSIKMKSKYKHNVHHSKNMVWIFNEKTKKSRRIIKGKPIPAGWRFGRK